MTIDPRYVPSSINTSPYKYSKGDSEFKGTVSSDNADRRTYTIDLDGEKVTATTDIYLSLKKKLVPGQVVMVVMNPMEVDFARHVCPMTEADIAKYEADMAKDDADISQSQAGASQSQGGASQSQAEASQARGGSGRNQMDDDSP